MSIGSSLVPLPGASITSVVRWSSIIVSTCSSCFAAFLSRPPFFFINLTTSMRPPWTMWKWRVDILGVFGSGLCVFKPRAGKSSQ